MTSQVRVHHALAHLETAALASLSLVLVATAGLSLGWRPNGDAAIMLYAALMQHDAGLVMYRDLFDMNAPGAHAIYAAVMAVAGGGDRALRILDLAAVAIWLAVTAAIMWPFGRRAAWAAAVLTGLLYLGSGEGLSLQREFFVLVPASLLLLTMFRAQALSWGRALAAYAAAGVCAGVASTIKPQAGLLLVVVASAAFSHQRQVWPRLQACAAAGAGCAAVWIAVAGWLWCTGAFAPFIEMATHYWPLYDALTGRPYGVVSGWSRAAYLLDGYVRGLAGPRLIWLAAAAIGLLWHGAGPRRGVPQRATPLVAFAAVTFVFPGLAGKFWTYHWLPFGYAMMLLAAMGLRDGDGRGRWRWTAFGLLLLVAVGLPVRAWTDRAARHAELATVDTLAAYLTGHLRPGDTVQPLDWTGTALHAMLRSRAPIATPFLEDVHFYHHAGEAYIVSLRNRLVHGLSSRPPRFIVQVDQPDWSSSPDSRHPFPALGRLLDADYAVVASGAGWTVYERRPAR